jgi:hypothetical protein
MSALVHDSGSEEADAASFAALRASNLLRDHSLVRFIDSSDVISFSQTKSGRLFNLPQVIENNGEPWRARTSDLQIKSAFTSTAAGYASYDLLTFVTGCSRHRVYLLAPIIPSLSVFSSQVCLKLFGVVVSFKGSVCFQTSASDSFNRDLVLPNDQASI